MDITEPTEPGLGSLAEKKAKMDAEMLDRLGDELLLEQNFNLALAGGAMAAIIGAVLWAALTYAFEAQIGFMALGVGALVGFAIQLFGKGITKPYGILGAVFSFLGCAVGNLLATLVFVSKMEGIPLLELFGYLDFTVVGLLMVETFNFMDLLFYGLAIVEGYKFSFRRLSEDQMRALIRKDII